MNVFELNDLLYGDVGSKSATGNRTRGGNASFVMVRGFIHEDGSQSLDRIDRKVKSGDTGSFTTPAKHGPSRKGRWQAGKNKTTPKYLEPTTTDVVAYLRQGSTHVVVTEEDRIIAEIRNLGQ